MLVRSRIYAPFGTCTGRQEYISEWIAASAQTMGHILAYKLMSATEESSSQATNISAIMSYRFLFANGIVHCSSEKAAPDNNSRSLTQEELGEWVCPIASCGETGTSQEVVEKHILSVHKDSTVQPVQMEAESMMKNTCLDPQPVLLRLLELMQQHTRLKLDPIKLQLARNYVNKSTHQARQVFSIFRSFLHHCALVCPSLEDLKPDVSLHVLECYEQAVSMILGFILSPNRDKAPEVVSAISARADFLITSTRAAITSAPGVHYENKTDDSPLFLNSPLIYSQLGGNKISGTSSEWVCPVASCGETGASCVAIEKHIMAVHNDSTLEPVRKGALMKSQSESLKTGLATPARQMARFLSDSELSPEKSVRRSAKSLWQKVRNRTSMIGYFLIQRKRRMVAATVRAFLLDDGLTLEQVTAVANNVQRKKNSVRDSLKICTMLCSKYSGAMLDSFRILCLGSICSSWHVMLDAGVCEFLEVELRDFLRTNYTAVLSNESGDDGDGRSKFVPPLLSVAVSAAVLQRTAAGIAR